MPDRIHLLPDSVANQIAAGEVIQRPASVIKELVENAVDSGADTIRVIVRDAGRTLIQVIDNGCGMSPTDARMAFERHATSKIASAEDLFTLRTMGFRGEALPSICAISMVELKSRARGADMGTKLEIHGSKVINQEAELCDEGTNIMVKNLFYNVPARRKFMKSDSVELSNIMREFERLALVNPGLKLSIDTGGKVIELRKGTLLQRIAEIWKGSLKQQLIPVEAETSTVRISGYISRPEFARRTNALQYFLVNGRNMRHPYFKKAVLNCYKGLIAPDTMPCFFIRFDIDPAAIDVNIHPTKDEIKFEEEAVIWSVLTAAIKASLGKHSAVPSIDFSTDADDIEIERGKPADTLPTFDIPEDYNPFAPVSTVQPHKTRGGGSDAGSTGYGKPGYEYRQAKNETRDWEKLYDRFMDSGQTQNASALSLPVESPADFSVVQFAEKYILAVLNDKVMVIDQYRAHLKILYEDTLRRMQRDDTISQALVFPELLEVAPGQESALEDVMPMLRSAGMMIEKEGDDYIVTGTMPGVSGQEAASIIMGVLDSVAEGSARFGADAPGELAEVLRRDVALAIAAGMAVKRGRILSDEEMRQLVSDLMDLPDPSFTPSGRRIITSLSAEDVERLLP